MPNYLHRTTKQYLPSTSPNNLPEPRENYIRDPDLSGVVGVSSTYWTITGDVVSEMSPAEKSAVDQALLDNSRDAKIQSVVDDIESDMRQVVKMIIAELNILRQSHGLPDRTLAQVRTQLRNGYGS